MGRGGPGGGAEDCSNDVRSSGLQSTTHRAARHGRASGQVMSAFGVGRTAAYRRVAACIAQGLLERLALLREEPSVLRATRAGLRFAGLDLGLCVVSPGSVVHWLRCTSAALELGERYGSDRVIAERELRWIEQAEGRAIYSAKLGQRPDGSDQLHRPDLALAISERPVAVEVELSPKAPRRLEAIIRAWPRASWVGGVLYLCEPGATRRGEGTPLLARRPQDLPLPLPGARPGRASDRPPRDGAAGAPRRPRRRPSWRSSSCARPRCAGAGRSSPRRWCRCCG